MQNYLQSRPPARHTAPSGVEPSAKTTTGARAASAACRNASMAGGSVRPGPSAASTASAAALGLSPPTASYSMGPTCVGCEPDTRREGSACC